MIENSEAVTNIAVWWIPLANFKNNFWQECINCCWQTKFVRKINNIDEEVTVSKGGNGLFCLGNKIGEWTQIVTENGADVIQLVIEPFFKDNEKTKNYLLKNGWTKIY